MLQDLEERFIYELGRIKSPEVFLGVVRILKVQLVKDDKPRDFSELCADVINSYELAPRKRKRELLKILREANASQGGINGN